MTERACRYPVLVVAILVVAFGLRVVAAWWWQAQVTEGRFVFGDSESYWVLAGQIAHGEPYVYGAGQTRIFRTPGYPIILSSLFFVSADPPVIWARLLGAVFGTAAVGGVMWLTRQLFSPAAALLAGLFAMLEPGAIGMSVFVLSEAPFCPLMLAQFIAWTAASRATDSRHGALYAAIAGAAAGLATLVRPSWLLFTPFALTLAVAGFPPRWRQLSVGAVMLLTCAAVMLPWWIRNYRLTGHLILTTTQVGASLYDGLHPEATGGSNMQFVERFYRAQRAADAASPAPLSGTFEERLDRRLRDAAVDWAMANPQRVAQLALTKFRRIWSPWPNAEELQSWSFRLLVLLGYLPVLILGVGGVIRFGWREWPYALCAVPAVYFTLLHMVFVGSLRYRQPALLVLMALAAGFVMSFECFSDRIREWMPGNQKLRNAPDC